METVAFYSYKGGVGRSLLLANTARFLAALGKGVVALDLDFEAPGLHYKLGPVNLKERAKKGGVVPYLVTTAKGTGAAPSLEKQSVRIPVPPDAGWLRLIPAGPSPAQSYWAALKELGERLRFDDASGQGVMALLDLQTRIAEELKPDYLLIDARTGVTELGGLTTTLLADTVVCLFVPNQESLDGTLAVVEALKVAPRLRGQEPVRVMPVVSRLMGEKVSGDERFTAGVKRLLELGESRVSGQTKESELFVLPHDRALAERERVVAGEQRASDFSPLYKAYLDLFQKLFPSSTKRAQQALERLEAVAEIKAALTRPHRGHYGFGDELSPWDASAIQEGVVYEAEQYRGRGSRYADLVCHDATGRPVMVVEFVTEDAKAAATEFWAKGTRLRCVVLLSRSQHSVRRNILTRLPDLDELRESGRWDPPLPKEFELLPDVGDRSVEPMLDALRRGHVEAVAWLVNAWQESTAAEWSGHPMRRHEWTPGVARRILDGLAATEDLRCAEEILRRAAPGHDDRPRGERRFRGDDMFPEDQLDEEAAQGLFAPLFWRLPIEAIVSYWKPRRHPEERPCFAGLRLLAHDLMGLIYDPNRSALAQAQDLADRLSLRPEDEDDRENRRVLRWVHRRRWEQVESPQLLDEVPPALVWDAVLRADLWFRGTLEEAKEKLGKSARLASAASLRGRLRGLADRGALAAQGLLGSYDASGRLDLYPAAITATAEVLGLSPRSLKSVVFIYFSAWTMAHQALDLDGQPGLGFVPSPVTSPFPRESPVHVALVQAFTHRLLVRLEDANLLAAFEKLLQHQPEPYRLRTAVRQMPLEELRMVLLRARANGIAVGMPTSGD